MVENEKFRLMWPHDGHKTVVGESVYGWGRHLGGLKAEACCDKNG